MNHWHYQLMYHKYDDLGEEGCYSIHEYYHMDDGDGWTDKPIDVTGNSIEDVKKSLMLMLHDIDKYGVKDYDER